MGRGLGSEILEFIRPQMALAYRLEAISQGPKNSHIPGQKPLPLALVMDMHASKTLFFALVMDMHASKTLCTVYINHRCINS